MKRRENKPQNRYISPPRQGTISQPIFTKFGEFVDLTDVITPAKFGYKTFIGFTRQKGGISHLPYRKQTAYITVPCATALACNTSPVDENVALNPALFVTGSAMNRRVMYLPVDM